MPLFSVGVTTYNRKDLLKRCLESLVRQTCGDFEVIVGNDYVAEALTAENVGITDSRIRFVNHPQNLGERGNLNALLAEAKGRYFTWQFDDDLYAPDFLERSRAALEQGGWPRVAFTSYEKIFDDRSPTPAPRGSAGDGTVMTGPDFLRRYLRGEFRAMGLTGVFETGYLRSIGGAQALTDGRFALYTEYLLLVHAVLLDRVAYVNSPLVYYFVHEGSWGNVNAELDLYRQAAAGLLRESVLLLDRAGLGDEKRTMVEAIMKLVVSDFAKHACAKPGVAGLNDSTAFSRDLASRFLQNGPALATGRNSWLVIPFLKAKLKNVLPAGIRIPLQKLHARFQ